MARFQNSVTAALLATAALSLLACSGSATKKSAKPTADKAEAKPAAAISPTKTVKSKGAGKPEQLAAKAPKAKLLAQAPTTQHILIVGGAKDKAGGEKALNKFRKSEGKICGSRGSCLKLEFSSDFPGLNPGFHIVTAGHFPDEKKAKTALAVAKKVVKDAYIRVSTTTTTPSAGVGAVALASAPDAPSSSYAVDQPNHNLKCDIPPSYRLTKKLVIAHDKLETWCTEFGDKWTPADLMPASFVLDKEVAIIQYLDPESGENPEPYVVNLTQRGSLRPLPKEHEPIPALCTEKVDRDTLGACKSQIESEMLAELALSESLPKDCEKSCRIRSIVPNRLCFSVPGYRSCLAEVNEGLSRTTPNRSSWPEQCRLLYAMYALAAPRTFDGVSGMLKDRCTPNRVATGRHISQEEWSDLIQKASADIGARPKTSGEDGLLNTAEKQARNQILSDLIRQGYNDPCAQSCILRYTRPAYRCYPPERYSECYRNILVEQQTLSPLIATTPPRCRAMTADVIQNLVRQFSPEDIVKSTQHTCLSK